MVVRGLLVVLTLLGAIPVRICTCGAAHHHHHRAPQPRESSHLPPIGTLPAIDANPAPVEHHDADCHAIKPRPLMTLGLQFDVTDVPSADSLAVALIEPIAPEPSPGHSIRDFHPPPDRPLFLSLCILRN
jgi:hypothetical protein